TPDHLRHEGAGRIRLRPGGDMDQFVQPLQDLPTQRVDLAQVGNEFFKKKVRSVLEPHLAVADEAVQWVRQVVANLPAEHDLPGPALLDLQEVSDSLQQTPAREMDLLQVGQEIDL